MPHAVDEFELQDQRDEEEIQRLFAGPESGADDRLAFLNRDLEVGEKADDAEDYEDIGDDDLADDEDELMAQDNGTNGHAASDGLDDFLSGEGAVKAEEGFADEPDFGIEDDLFGEGGVSSPVDETTEVTDYAQPPPPKSRIALPGQNGIALPNGQKAEDQRMRESPDSLDHNDLAEDPDEGRIVIQEEEEEDEDDGWAEQKALFAAAERERQARAMGGNMYEPPPAPETEMDVFYSIWPSYDPDKTPRFTELFPPRRGKYNWKQPVKPPKPVNPTKVNLELQQDQERSFRISGGATANKIAREAKAEHRGIIHVRYARAEEEQSEDGMDLDEIDENEEIGGVSWNDLTMICEEWDVPALDSSPSTPEHPSTQADSGVFLEDSWGQDAEGPPAKRQKTGHFDLKAASAFPEVYPSLEDPEQAAAKIAKKVTLDMNDPGLLMDENVPVTAPKKVRRAFGERGRNANKAMVRDITRRYNISNDEAYELLKENHQHKVRSTLGSMAVEHSMPALKLQFPFYRVKLEPKQLRSFHRPAFAGERINKEIKFSKPKSIKRKHMRGKDAQAVFAKSEDLSLGDNSSALLLEYSEEYPVMLSNFGMGNRLINYYRRKDEADTSRPKEEVGETQVLLPQDRSPFANFGSVDPGEVVPTIQNGLYRAPIFKHEGRPQDFLVVVNTSAENGRKYYMRNLENIYAVGQQFPSQEVPGEHSRKVTDAAKRRLRAISYRVYRKSIDPLKRGPPLTNKVVQDHLPGSDIAQNRGKMREFMAYDKEDSKWVPKKNDIVPDEETLRAWIKPEDICLLDSMQVGVQHLTDLGLKRDDAADDEDGEKEGANIELQLAPWQTTKNFLNACQGKAMLQLHGEGDPTARGEAFSFIKTSMKGGFRALGESIEDRLDAKRLKENGGHSYNVARQQKAYDDSIRRIWKAQQDSLSSNIEHSDTEADEDDEDANAFARRGTPRSSFGTPAALARHDDETMSQFSRMSASTANKVLIIHRRVRNQYGEFEDVPVRIENPRVIAAYRKKKLLEQSRHVDIYAAQATGDQEFNALQAKKVQNEIARLERNMDRREARERAKGILGSPSVVGSPGGPGEGEGEAGEGKPGKKARGKKNTEGTQRKCANCGQVGHIKTNKKFVSGSSFSPSFLCSSCEQKKSGFGGGRSGAADGGWAVHGGRAQSRALA